MYLIPKGFKSFPSYFLFKVFLLILAWLKLKVDQSCPTLCSPMDYTVHGILQAEYRSG